MISQTYFSRNSRRAKVEKKCSEGNKPRKRRTLLSVVVVGAHSAQELRFYF